MLLDHPMSSTFYFKFYQAILNQSMHSKLKNNLIEHTFKLHEKRLRKQAAMGIKQGSNSSSSVDGGDGGFYS
ncbi:hypothetical protein VP01_4227g1 [Puccinia sorghi]|uniref:Uncharacterized protein n=1 Tax=Puccinia sorghi TaxID=27349 RepID=A0A0L6UQJ6_9BASI|nr:hypothetical protein VP01_4227g1 [Puccinia sorghi]